jgi:hypothetical protein
MISRKVAKAQRGGRVSSDGPSGHVASFAPLRLGVRYSDAISSDLSGLFWIVSHQRAAPQKRFAFSVFSRRNSIWQQRAGMIECGHATQGLSRIQLWARTDADE